MEINLFRGLITAALLALFIGLFAWAWSKRRRDTFEEAARMPLDDSERPATQQHGREHRE